MVARVRIFVALLLGAALVERFEPRWSFPVFLAVLAAYVVVVMPGMKARRT